jgi:hypothetical protein
VVEAVVILAVLLAESARRHGAATIAALGSLGRAARKAHG